MHILFKNMKSYLIFITIVMACFPRGSVKALEVEKIVEKTTAYLEELNAQNKFSGAVLIAKDGVPILKRAYGLANRSFNVPNRIDTKFNLGSMNKMFTGVAILQLVEQRKLALDDKIIKHVPDYPNKEIASKVTIHQLLTHTSGMGLYWTDEYMKTSKDRLRDIEDYLPLFVDQPLQFKPGSKFSYSNSGYMVLGLIIEKVTGQSYFDYVMENIYKPAGMINTDAYELDYVVPNLAVGYTRAEAREGEIKNNLYIHVCKGGPAGGGYSTVEDLLSFSNALLGNKLLSPEYTELAIKGKVRRSENVMYAYGIQDRSENNHRIIGHGGGFPGISSNLEIYKDLGYTVIVMSNFDRGSIEVENFIKEQLIGKTQYMKDVELTKFILEHITENGYDSGIELYEENREKGRVLEGMVNQYGYELLAEGKISKAIDIFKFNVYIHPESANCYDSLGEAYMEAGNKELAIKNYEKSLELNPDNKNSVKILQNLREE
ncbi:MAG: serine hydrolase [Candidatus Bathyarchaeota archaeon]|nr:serine hydrolase [Candidatus Bathyarchaeota archaeon]